MIRRCPSSLLLHRVRRGQRLIATDPMALLIGFVLDQQVTVQKAFIGPLVLRERLGAIDAETVAGADLDRSSASVPRSTATRARWPSACTTWPSTSVTSTTATRRRSGPRPPTPTQLRANLAAVPGLGEMKVKSLGSVLAKQFGVAAAQPLVPWHPTLGDVDSAQALADYQAAKRAAQGRVAARARLPGRGERRSHRRASLTPAPDAARRRPPGRARHDDLHRDDRARRRAPARSTWARASPTPTVRPRRSPRPWRRCAPGENQYAPLPGVPALREAVRDHQRSHYGLEPEDVLDHLRRHRGDRRGPARAVRPR